MSKTDHFSTPYMDAALKRVGVKVEGEEVVDNFSASTSA